MADLETLRPEVRGRGPCKVCGATGYALSYGGPDICPACDCGINPEVSKLKRELADARAELLRLAERNKALEAKATRCDGWRRCRTCRLTLEVSRVSERSETNVGLTDLLDGWRRTADELPPIDTPVWLCEPSGTTLRLWIGERADDPDGWLWTDCEGSAYFADGAWTATDSEAEDYHPTHWRPLPQPPNA